MKYMHKALWQADGNLVIRGNSRALLFRALQDAREALARCGADAAEELPALRTLRALQQVLGEYDGPLPSANALLGDPVRERTSRNLLKL